MLGFSKKKILIVEDDHSIIKALQDSLQREGYEVAVATAGTQAVGQIQLTKPDLLILDVLLPGKSGQQVLEQIRGQEMGFDKPILVLSSMAEDQEQAERHEKYGVTFINKANVSISEVQSVVAHMLEEKPAH